MSMEEGPAMASLASFCSPLLPSSSGTLPFLRRVSLSGMMTILARMHVPGARRSVRMHGAMGLARLLGWVSLIDQLYYSQEGKGVHGFRRLELCWKGCVLPGSANRIHRQAVFWCNYLDTYM